MQPLLLLTGEAVVQFSVLIWAKLIMILWSDLVVQSKFLDSASNLAMTASFSTIPNLLFSKYPII